MASTENDDPAQIAHRVRGANGQTADLFVVEVYGGTDKFAVDKDGNITAVGDFALTGGLSVSGAIEAPMSPDATSYIVWKSGSTYYAKNGATGAVVSSSADAAVTINAAFTACAALGGGSVELTAGTFVTTSGINRPGGCHLRGQGWHATTIQAGSASNLITISSSVSGTESRGSISGLTLDGNGVGVRGIISSRKYIEKIEDVWIKGFTSHGMHMTDCVYLWLVRVRIKDNGGYGLYVDNSAIVSTTLRCYDVTTGGNDSGGFYYAGGTGHFIACSSEIENPSIYLHDASDFEVRRCYFEGTGGTADAIIVDGCKVGVLGGNHFQNLNRGIAFSGVASDQITIEPNAFYTITTYAVDIPHDMLTNYSIHPQNISTAYPGGVIRNLCQDKTGLQMQDLYPINPGVCQFKDDFLGKAKQPAWNEAAGIFSYVAGDSGRVRMTTATALNSVATMNWNSMYCVDRTSKAKFIADAIVTAVATLRDDQLGLSNGGIAAANHGAYFESLSGEANWYAVTSDGSARTRTDTGIARSVAARNFVIELKASSVVFYLSGSVTTNTTNLPSTDTNMEPFFQVTTREDGVARILDIDYVELLWTRGGVY